MKSQQLSGVKGEWLKFENVADKNRSNFNSIDSCYSWVSILIVVHCVTYSADQLSGYLRILLENSLETGKCEFHIQNDKKVLDEDRVVNGFLLFFISIQ